MLGGKMRSVKTWLNWMKLVGLEADRCTYDTPRRAKYQVYGGSRYLRFSDVDFWDKVCQNLIKSNKVSGDRSGYTYLRLPSKGKGICKAGAASFMIFWWWVVGQGHQNLLRLGRNGEGLKAYTYLVFTPKNKGPKCKGSHLMGDFW